MDNYLLLRETHPLLIHFLEMGGDRIKWKIEGEYVFVKTRRMENELFFLGMSYAEWLQKREGSAKERLEQNKKIARFVSYHTQSLKGFEKTKYTTKMDPDSLMYHMDMEWIDVAIKAIEEAYDWDFGHQKLDNGKYLVWFANEHKWKHCNTDNEKHSLFEAKYDIVCQAVQY